MNRGFGFYFGNAIKSSAKTLWHKGNLIKYFAWVIMELLSPFTVILGAMFSLANIRQAKIAERENTVDIPQSFKVACQAKPFWTMLLAIILEALIFIAGVILIGIAGGLLGAVGYVVSCFVDTIDPEIIIMIFFAPSGLVLLVYCVIMTILMAPTAYVIETNPDIGAADAISICFNTMKSRGKGTCFLNYFIPALVEGAILGLGAVIEVVLWLFVSVNDPTLYVVLAVLVAIIFFVAFALVAPMFALARKISNKSLFEDIVLDPVNASKHTSGVNIKKCKGVKFDPAEYENELALLFDETYSDRIPLPESPSARRKRQLEERKAAKMSASVDYTKTLLEDTAPYTPAPVKTDSDEDGDLITVSDLIRDVETEAPAEAVKEEPVQEPEAVEPAAEEKTEAPAEPEPVKEEEPAEEVAATPADEPEQTEEEAEEPETEEPAEEPAPKAAKPATKTTATKSTAAKTTATKSTAAKSTATKAAATKSTAAKTTATKSTATKTAATAKSTAAKTTAATKSTATKSTAAKSTATKSTATKSTTAKPAATKSTATKSTAAKSTTSKSTATKSTAKKQ